ncbi:GNAT family N-acetyltransferase [Streptomyces sp. ISL-10]|uniref:GNAT family N-acetyltransferase n=1 Tax=Streptomyces sp. ISL-10 TaxID=2819172 RepID=UPI001BE850C7|nr:GNAT family protein [Streptomyces sp. ISL-10]MBT2365508.1 GNAT family N-acetyltransferase [Streptomyces sp. ISL-10]
MIFSSAAPADGLHLRPLALRDAENLLNACLHNREHLRQWEPERGERYFTLDGQTERLRDQVAEQEAGRLMGWLIGDGERVVGRVNLANIVGGAFRSANLGYWIDAQYEGRGLATAAVELACRAADEDLGLHRVEAGTLLENAGSQRVLEKCGFTVVGTAAEYLHINGAWRDHRIFQRILNRRDPVSSGVARQLKRA